MSYQIIKKISAAIVLSLAIAAPSHASLSPGDKTSIKQVEQETRELIKSIESYSADQRDQAIQEIEIAIIKLDNRIESLQKRLDEQWQGMTAEAREKARSSLDALQQQRKDLAGWYSDLKGSSASAWSDIRSGFSKAYRNINKAWEKALNDLDDNDAASDS